MANLKSIKNRIKSVKSTQKITKAMKVVAAAKLRRAKTNMEEGRFYLDAVTAIFRQCLPALASIPGGNMYLPSGKEPSIELLVVLSSDRGLCGPFNSSVIRAVKKYIAQAEAKGNQVKLLLIGNKANEALTPYFPKHIVGHFAGIAKNKADYNEAKMIVDSVFALVQTFHIERCVVIYNRFNSAISQTMQQFTLLPFEGKQLDDTHASKQTTAAPVAEPLFEPSQAQVAEIIAKRYVTASIFQALLHHAASEHGARMTAMDNATRAAGDMIKALSLVYNRTRQATITKELIEIISGAEAV
jgi:F-type H+-transporting ATPase subunit gamma